MVGGAGPAGAVCRRGDADAGRHHHASQAANAFHESHDRIWDEEPPLANPAFIRMWFLRCKDLIDSYRPDLLYFDNTGLPLGQAGLDIAAHYYNSSIAWHGQLQAVRQLQAAAGGPPRRRGRGCRARLPLRSRAASLADRHLHRRLALQPRAFPATNPTCRADAVVHRLCDVVAKNGCLLLSVPVRGDGTIDAEERKIVEGVGELDRALWRGDLRHRGPGDCPAKARPRWRRASSAKAS